MSLYYDSAKGESVLSERLYIKLYDTKIVSRASKKKTANSIKDKYTTKITFSTKRLNDL